MPVRISAYREQPATPGARGARRLVTPPAQKQESEQGQSNLVHNESYHVHDQPHPVHDRFWRWCEEKEARESRGKERREAPERPRELPRLWREGERYFNHGVKEQYRREMRDYERGQLSWKLRE